jgi:hypothetical protein
MQTDPAAIAFNRGSDARLRGRPILTNPYSWAEACVACQAWQAGWLDVHSNWGRHVRGRWPVATLPRVAEAAAPERA